MLEVISVEIVPQGKQGLGLGLGPFNSEEEEEGEDTENDARG